jgi:peptide/nickel transport system substrate-binding protein
VHSQILISRRLFSLFAIVLAISACAPAPSQAPAGAPQGVTGQQAAPQTAPASDPSKKTITIGLASSFYAFSLADRGLGVGGGGSLQELWLQGLVTSGFNTPAPEARVAKEVPTLENGSMRLESDGRVTVTWTLRDDVKWADGAPVTSQDFLFGYELGNDTRLPFLKSGLRSRLQSMSAPDDRTLVMVWKESYYLANAIGTGAGLQPLPRHHLYETYQNSSPEAFENHPYWTQEFFHIGPYRPVRFEPQVELVLQPVPNYFLGAPKVGNIIVKMFQDTNTVYANMLAGGLDTANSNALEEEQALQLKERWESTGGGKVLIGPGNSQLIAFQFSPELQTEPTLLDPKVRQALRYAIDMPTWTDTVMGGKVSGLLSNGLLPPNHHLASYTNDAYGMYNYDQTRAQRMLADAGWTRGSDGFVTHASNGRRFQISVWSTTEASTLILSDYWKQVGLDSSVYVLPRSRTSDREFWQTLPNVEISSRGYGDEILQRIECDQSATPANGYNGFNRGHFCDQARMETAISGFRRSLNLAEQGRFLRQAADVIAQDVPIIQTYFALHQAAVPKGVVMFDDDGGGLPGTGVYGSYYRNGHLWDRQ